MKSKTTKPPRRGALIKPSALPLGLVNRLSAGRDPVFANVPAAELVRPMLMSRSLSQAEKQRILDELPTLSLFQIEKLMKLFADERRELKRMVRAEFHVIAALQARAICASLELVRLQDDVAQPLLDAWARRMLRHGARRGLRAWLDTLPSEWWSDHAEARQLYRRLDPSSP